jgi:hypothetical protein
MAFYPIDNYPRDEASGIPRNATIWVQFNKSISSGTANYLTVSVASPDDDYVPLDGQVQVKASTNGTSGIVDTVIQFLPDPAYDAYKRYGFFITGGEDGISALDGERLPKSLEYYFIAGSGTTVNTDVPATGVPTTAAATPTVPLAVMSTYPANYATAIPVSSYYIKITFNDAISSGINLYDYITLSKANVL